MVNCLETRPREGLPPWQTTLRKLLKRRGLALLRLEGPPPPTWRETLGRLRAEAEWESGGTVPGVGCLDGELQTQTDLLGVFPAERVRFAPEFAAWRRDRPAGYWPILVVDPASCRLSELLDDEETRGQVRTILVRASLGYFWTGGGDAGQMARAFRAAGFRLDDVLGQTGLLTWSAPLEPVLLVFKNERSSPQAANRATGAAARVAEALAVWSQPLARTEGLRRLAGRGSFGFASGVLNPGAIRRDGRTVLLARGERVPWAVQKVDEAAFMDSARPLLVELTPDRTGTERGTELSLTGGGESGPPRTRIEDFRLFSFRDEIYSNFAMTSVPGRLPQKGRRVETSALTTRVGLARLEPDGGGLRFIGEPRLDRPTTRVEKNWAMFEAQGRLHLLYSFQPYRLLRADRWPTPEFTGVQERELRLPPDTLPASSLRNSINPTDYNEKYLLHVVHAVFPTKRYVFWAVLIDKFTLLPVMVSACPLVGGWHSAPASMVYVTAVVAGPDELEIYGGLNDSSVGRWTLRRELLDATWQPLA